MSVFKLKSTIRINCAKRLTPYLAEEVEALGYKIIGHSDTGVEIEGTLVDCMKLNLYLKTAYRVLFLIDEFEAATPDILYRNLVDIPWEEYIDTSGYVSVTSFADNINIKDTRFANLRVKDAVMDRIQNKQGRRPDSGPDTSRTVLYLYWKNNEAAIFFDTSGDTIAKHGYRKLPFKAPMQEALAAAAIMATKWDRQSHFVNPMCGSGTLAIEAALIATNKAVGLMRNNFGFMHILGYDPQVWKDMRTAASREIKRNLPFKIIATDIDPKAIRAAEINAREAMVDHLIVFKVLPFEQTILPPAPGVLMMNPEYGERMGEEEELEDIYKQIGDFLKQKASGYIAYVFTANMELAKKIGLKASRRIEFYNSTLDSRLLEYEMYQGSKREPRKE